MHKNFYQAGFRTMDKVYVVQSVTACFRTELPYMWWAYCQHCVVYMEDSVVGRQVNSDGWLNMSDT